MYEYICWVLPPTQFFVARAIPITGKRDNRCFLRRSDAKTLRFFLLPRSCCNTGCPIAVLTIFCLERHCGMVKRCQNLNDPVDGSEIRPSPVELGRFSHYLQGFYTSKKVVQDFWTINSLNIFVETWNSKDSQHQSFSSCVRLTSDSESKSSSNSSWGDLDSGKCIENAVIPTWLIQVRTCQTTTTLIRNLRAPTPPYTTALF